MSLHRITAEQAMARLSEFSAIIDARSPAEFAQDHLPGAVNWPTLDDEQRHQVGTEYKQVSAFEAKKRGAAIAARNIAAHIDRELMDKPKDWAPLIYCWRGGKRSGSLSLVLDQIGFRVSLIEGGYKAFRSAVIDDLALQVGRLHWRVICGTTGSGKTRLLHALAEQGAQVLDLEGLARHRSSVLGLLPGQIQPTQKAYDTLLWDALRQFSADRPVYVESESKKVGNLAVADSLITAMRNSPCLRLALDDVSRVRLLIEDYPFFVSDTGFFCERLATLVEVRGRERVQHWQELARSGQTEAVVEDLLTHHYDPAYIASIRRNFRHYETAPTWRPRDHSHQAMRELAEQILSQPT